ncbi:MAG: MFS transporter [Hyphomicrobiales bacterium]|nr:MFS transporter [Hyphomicrobiales bacterium]
MSGAATCSASAARFANPWRVVAGAVAGLTVCNGPVLFFTSGVFLKPIAADMHWQRSTVSFALSLATFLSALATPALGRMMDRSGVRAVSLPGIPVFAVSLAILALSPSSPAAFVVLAALAGVASTVQAPLPYAKAISAWFDDRRGLALGIAMAGVGLGAILVPQIARALIDWVGWRGAYVGLGAVTLAVAFPAVALTIREPDVRAGGEDAQARLRQGTGVTAREAARTSQFWLMAAVFMLAGAAINGANAHIVPLLTDRGLTPAAATGTFSVMGFSTLVGRPFIGVLLDRIFAPCVAAAFFMAPLAGLPLLAGGSGVSPVIGAALLGLALGAEIDLIAFLTTRYLGQRAFGEIYGYLFTAFVLGSSVGQFIADLSYDRLGSYTPAMIGFAFALVAAALLVNRLGQYVYLPQLRIAPELVQRPAE